MDKNRIKIVALIFISFLLMFVSYVLFYPEKFNLCNVQEGEVCIAPYGSSVGEPMFLGLISVIAVLIILFIFRNAYQNIKVFSIIYIPIAVVIIASTPVVDPHGFLPGMDREIMTTLLSLLYFIISLVIILVSHLKSKKV